MNEHRPPEAFDAQARQWHAQSLQALSTPTLARLRAARRAGAQPRRHGPRWLLASAGSATLAVALVLGLQQHHATPPPAVPATATSLAVGAAGEDDVLDQNPDLYVWLGSENALAME